MGELNPISNEMLYAVIPAQAGIQALINYCVVVRPRFPPARE